MEPQITGESQAEATAVNQRLARLQSEDLASRLLAIGQKTASRMRAETKQLDHGALLYDELSFRIRSEVGKTNTPTRAET